MMLKRSSNQASEGLGAVCLGRLAGGPQHVKEFPRVRVSSPTCGLDAREKLVIN
ncbi:MAG: hypothetical protein QOD75_2956 [Blastocatellia bacterium]|nr:hypothetical protein [Blastocatellia bacterium]